jgi:hypothetical protein
MAGSLLSSGMGEDLLPPGVGEGEDRGRQVTLWYFADCPNGAWPGSGYGIIAGIVGTLGAGSTCTVVDRSGRASTSA